MIPCSKAIFTTVKLMALDKDIRQKVYSAFVKSNWVQLPSCVYCKSSESAAGECAMGNTGKTLWISYARHLILRLFIYCCVDVDGAQLARTGSNMEANAAQN